jgi:hypothetical protein
MSLKIQVTGINAFLTILYNQETRLSNLLAKLNFDPQQIDGIRTQYLEQLVCACISFVRACIISGYNGSDCIISSAAVSASMANKGLHLTVSSPRSSLTAASGRR